MFFVVICFVSPKPWTKSFLLISIYSLESIQVCKWKYSLGIRPKLFTMLDLEKAFVKPTYKEWNIYEYN